MSDKRTEHMKSRYNHQKSLRKTADEFGVSKSTIHRKVKENGNMEKLTSEKPKEKKPSFKKEKYSDMGQKGKIKSPAPAPSINKKPVSNPFKKKSI